jgi:hypothetical protein
MKITLAPKVAVSLAIFAATCGAAVTIANAAGKLRDLGWAIIPLFVIACTALIFAVVTVARASKDPASASPEEQAEDINPEDVLALFHGRTEMHAQIYVRRWLGKRVRVRGPLGAVSPGLSIYVALAGPNGLHNCFFWIPPTQSNDFAHLQLGTEITVEGTIESVDGVAIQLEKIQLVKIEDQPV